MKIYSTHLNCMFSINMTDLKFEGDLNGVNKRQLEFIRSVLEKRGYKNESVLFEVAGKACDNFVAIVKRITVIKDGVTFNVIAKIAPDNAFCEIGEETIRIIFQNEHYMYTHVLPKFNNMLRAAGVPKEDTLKYAACYDTYMEETNEVILLEDMKLSNFQMLDRFKSLDNTTVKLVLKNLAILHCASFALKEQEPETYEHFCNNLINFWLFTGDEDKKRLFLKREEDVKSILDKDKYKKIVNGSLSEFGNHFVKMNDIDRKSKYSVIQHGDAWINNIMFTMEGNKAVKCCMIDYQASSVGTPAGDIHCFIFNCTDYETRSKHYHEWIDYYHSELEKSLSNFDLKINYVYPRDKLDDDMKRYTKRSLFISVISYSVLIRESRKADTAKMKKAIETKNGMADAMETTKWHKNMIEGIVDSFLELGYLSGN